MDAKVIAQNKDNLSIEQLERMIREYAASRYARGYKVALREMKRFKEKKKARYKKEFDKFLDELTQHILDNKKIR